MQLVRKAFTMNVFPEYTDEYIRRHNELWPEMREAIMSHGCKTYSIFLDWNTNTLFAYLEIENPEEWSKLADTEINRKWWDYMAPIMETNPDNSPVENSLEEAFHIGTEE